MPCLAPGRKGVKKGENKGRKADLACFYGRKPPKVGKNGLAEGNPPGHIFPAIPH
jgi:hypothetical protein